MNLIQWFSLAGICTRKAGSGGKTHAFCPGRAAAVNEGTSEKSPRTAATTQAAKPRFCRRQRRHVRKIAADGRDNAGDKTHAFWRRQRRHVRKIAGGDFSNRRGSRPISRVLSRAIIPLGSASPRTSSGLPGSARGSALHPCSKEGGCFPIWPCSRWGLPCQPCYQGRGALLPHRFTLAVPGLATWTWAVCSLLHFPWARAPQALPGT